MPGTLARREGALYAAIAALAAVALVWGFAWDVRANDYGNEAAASFAALLHGHLSTFLAQAPVYGPSLLLRAPFALPGSLSGAGTLTIFRLSALPCALALALLGAWLAREARRHGATLAAAALALALAAANPISYKALAIGHPEELLGAALSAAAVLLALRGRVGWAALALGVAVANKEWALLAAGPVLVAAPRHRWRTLALGAVAAAALLLPFVLAAGGVPAADSSLASAGTGTVFTPWQVFWFFARRGETIPSQGIYIPRGFHLPPAWLGPHAQLVIVAIGAVATLLALWRRTRREDALLLLALMLLLRCWLDPWDVVYYPLPFIVALLAWETGVRRRAPRYAAIATAQVWLIFWYLPDHVFDQNTQAISFLVPATLAIALLAAAVYRVPLRRSPAALALAPSALNRAPAVPS